MDKKQYLFFRHRWLNKLKIFRNNLHIFVICYVLFRVFLFLIYKLSILYTQTFFMIISSETENVSDSPNKTFFIPDRSAPHRTVPPPKSLKRLFLFGFSAMKIFFKELNVFTHTKKPKEFSYGFSFNFTFQFHISISHLGVRTFF